MVATVSEEPAALRQEFSLERCCLTSRRCVVNFILADSILDFGAIIVALFLSIHPEKHGK